MYYTISETSLNFLIVGTGILILMWAIGVVKLRRFERFITHKKMWQEYDNHRLYIKYINDVREE